MIVRKATRFRGTSAGMTKPTIDKLTVILFSTLAMGGCGTDPYAGESTPAGTGGITTPTGGAPATGGTIVVSEPDAAAPDAPLVAVGVGQYAITVAPNRLLDLVFMVDNSPSMAPKQAKMNAQFPKLIAALKDPNDGTLPDLRVAIIDSDLGTNWAYSSGSCGPKNGTGLGDLGHFQMINATGCGVNSADALYIEYKGGQPVNYTGDINTVFQCLASGLGTLGCGEEHQLQAFEFALLAAGINNEAQQQMLRPTATLGLVFLSDEDDCSAYPNDGMFGAIPFLSGESASLRCYTRSYECNGNDTSNPPPGYPTSAAFTASPAFTACAARTGDTCSLGEDVSQPTNCNPLKDVVQLASELKGLKNSDPDRLLVAGIFGWPLASSDPSTAQYKVGLVPNPNSADTAHPTIWDTWPVCYDPGHQPAVATTDSTTGFDQTAAGWGATPGLRMSRFIDEFGANGLKYSICESDFTAAMTGIGNAIAKKLQNLCLGDKLVDQDTVTPGLQPDCTVNYCVPSLDPNDPTKVVYACAPTSLPACPDGATSGNVATDCWKLTNDTTKCPAAYNGQMVNVLRTAAEIAAGPLAPGTEIHMQCRICPSASSADPAAGCSY